VDMNKPTRVTNENSRYFCGWTPFHQHEFSSHIESTWVNGQQVYDGNNVIEHASLSKRLTFNR